MTLRARFRQACNDESGFAIVLGVALMTLVTVASLSIMVLATGEDSHSRRDQSQDGAYQAAEAGTNAYLSDLTESNVFWSGYMAKGEATRTDSSNNAHANNCSSTCSDMVWNSGSWGTTWTYKTAPASDTGWFSMGNGYQYLIKVYPPNASLSGLAQVITRIDVTGRPTGSTNTSTWRTIETMIRPSALSDFQAFSAGDLSYAASATTTGPIFVGEDNSGTPGNLSHAGTAKANLYAEGTVTVGGSTLQNGAKKYDSGTSPTALCKLNNCSAIQWSQFAANFSSLRTSAQSIGLLLGTTDNGNSALSGQSPAYKVDTWRLDFSVVGGVGKVTYSSCKLFANSNGQIYPDYDGPSPPVCGNAKTVTIPASGVIYVDTDAIVDGVVKGKVTVGTSGSIIYGGNVTYNTNGQDVLGVMSTGTVWIAQWGVDANGNITIWSAQFSQNGMYSADTTHNTYNPNPSKCSGGSGDSTQTCHAVCSSGSKCVMTIYGSTAVYGNGAGNSSIVMTNMFNARSYNYDPNLLFVQPPQWPTLGNAFTILVQREI
ncbi:MAG TPA: hypothetical protein VMB53_13990 [Gaiellaceae bacterium]|nr:hypothetical protein [Gaiellaceae bacterium]